jgi:hypothetical protein
VCVIGMNYFLHGVCTICRFYRGSQRVKHKEREREREREINMRIVFGAEHL